MGLGLQNIGGNDEKKRFRERDTVKEREYLKQIVQLAVSFKLLQDLGKPPMNVMNTSLCAPA